MFDLMSQHRLSDEQRDLRREVREFVAESVDPLDFNDWEWREDPHDRVPWHVIESAHERGLHDLTVPAEYGGRDASPLTVVVAAEELGAGDVGVAITLELLWRNVRLVDELATDERRDRFFEAFVDDPHHLLALGLTERRHGTNYHIDHEGTQFETVAERSGDGWVIHGEKRFISCGAEAKTHVVFAQTDQTVSAQEGTTAFLVPADAPGIAVTHMWEKTGARLLNNATLQFDDVYVPAENVLGEVNAAKRHTGDVLKTGQLNSGAIALGNARRAFDEAYAYANEREQGGTAIVNHQSVAHEFAEMSMDLEAMRSLLWTAAQAVEHRGDDYEAAYGQLAKLFAATNGADVARRALEMFGALGVMLGNDRPIQKYHRDSVVYLHADGTRNAHNEVVSQALSDRYTS